MGSIIDASEVLLEMGLSSSVTEEERAIVEASILRAESAVRSFLAYDPAYAERTEYYPQEVSNNAGQGSTWDVNATSAYVRMSAGGQSTELQIRHLPIRSITSLYIDYDGRFGTKSGAFSASTLKTSGEDYWANFTCVDGSSNGLCKDGIVRSNGLWPNTPGSVKIIYTSGYTKDEFHGSDFVVDGTAIAESVLEESLIRAKRALSFWKKSSTSGHLPGLITSEKLGDYSYQLDASTATSLFGSSVNSMSLSDLAKVKLGPFVNYGWAL